MPRVADLGDCPLCFGQLLPLSVCQSCNSVVARGGLEEVGPSLVCEDCGATNPTHFVCSACNARFPFAEIVKPEGPTCPVCKNPVPMGAALCPHCSAVLPVADTAGTRPRRRIRGEYGEEDVHEVGRIPGVGRPKAEALCAAGYNALWKIARTSEAELSKVKGIGAKSAAGIKESLKFLLLVGRRKSKEEVLSEEYECPLCGTLTSLFATRCHDCGAEFDEEELDEEFRKEVEREEDKGLLAYYDVRLLENPEGAALHYARGALLLSMRRASDALAAFERVLQLEPANRRAAQAKARALAGAKGIGAATQVLRESVRPSERAEPKPVKVEEVKEALEALGTLEDVSECPECGEKQVPGATLCPVCGHRFGPQPTPVPAAEARISLDEERLLDELERAVAGERAAPPPPLKPEVPAAVVDKKRAMLAFLLRVPGVSRRAAEAVSGFFQDLDQIGMTEVADLTDIPGVAPAEARMILAAVTRQIGPIEDVSPTEPVPIPPRPKPKAPPEVIEEAEEVRPTPRPAAPKPGPTPEISVARRPMELVAGRRGLINGRGLVNGRGRVNGLINGTGFVNGSSLAEMRLPRKNFLPRYIAIGASMIMLFTIAAVLVAPSGPAYLIKIDGDFQDWTAQRVPRYLDGTPSTNGNIEITGLSVYSADSVLFLRVTVRGAMFGDVASYDTLYAFLDVDGNTTNGYDLGDVGADYLVQLSGSAGAIEDGRLAFFDQSTGRTRLDWAAWAKVGTVEAASKDRDVEIAVSTDGMSGYDSSRLRVRIALDDNAGETSHLEFPVGLSGTGGALRVIQEPATSTVTPVGMQRLLQLRFTAFGGPVTVSQVSVFSNVATSNDIPPNLAILGGQTRFFNVSVDPSTASPGAVVFARVAAVLADRPYAILGEEARAYVGGPPAAKIIDGLFGDWTNITRDSDSAPIDRPSLDIFGRDQAVVGTNVFVFVQLNGTAVEGTFIPARVIRPPPGGQGGGNPGPGPPHPPAVGQDYVRFYLDTNASDSYGLSIGGVFADRLIEVRGRGGRVANASLYSWSASDWLWNDAVSVGVLGPRLEAGIVLPGVSSNVTVLAITADWAGVGDVSDALGTRGGTRGSPGFTPMNGSNALTAVAFALSSTPTVDGNCGTGGANEYLGSAVYSDANVRFLVGRRTSIQRVFLCLEVLNDSDSDSDDWGEIVLDLNHTGGSAPNAHDRRFRIFSSNQTFLQHKGDGSVWVNCGAACDASNAAAGALNNSKETYEFSITFQDTWGTSTPGANEVSGFALKAVDAGGGTWTWGSDTVDENVPNTWGHLEIPEFPGAFTGVIAVALLLGLCRRRRQRPRT